MSELKRTAGASRREFLRRAGTTLAVAAGAGGLSAWLYDPTGKRGLAQPEGTRLKDYFAAIDYGPGEPRICVARGQDVGGMVRAALEPMGGMKRFVGVGDVVLLKPNVAFDRPASMGATTSPDLVREVAKLCREAGAKKVIVADNPIESPEGCFAKTGIGEAAGAGGAVVMLPSPGHFREIAIRQGPPDRSRGEILGSWPIFWPPLAEAHKVIGLPVIKDHNLCYASMGLKNWYGLLGGRRNQFHQAIHEIVSDLAIMVSPTLMIADGTRVLMRNGPTGGRLSDVKPAHTVVASVDAVACDAWCYENLLERDPAKLAYLELAQQKIGGGEPGQRFGQRDWRVYQRQGLVVELNV